METTGRNIPLIDVRDIVKNYGRTRALDHVSLQFGGGITGLLGPNGAGKSTLIKVILGLVHVNAGTGTVLARQLGREGKAIRALTGYMPEDDCFIPGMSGIEVLRFSASLAGMDPVEGLRRGHEILDFCGVAQERYRDIETYSSGMRQKIKFASALVHDPQLLILDEPTSHLDPEEREDLLNRIRVLAREFRKPVILCTHILRDVQLTCDHVVILLQGKVKLSQSLEALNRPTAPITEIRYGGNGADFAQQIERAGIACEPSSENEVRLLTDAPERLAEIWRLALAAGVTIQSMTPTRNSLEHIFMSAVRGDEDAGQ